MRLAGWTMLIVIYTLCSCKKEELDRCSQSNIGFIDVQNICAGSLTMTLKVENEPYSFSLNGNAVNFQTGGDGFENTRYYVISDSTLFKPFKGTQILIIKNKNGCEEKKELVFNEKIQIQYHMQNALCGRGGRVQFTATGFTGEHSFSTNMLGDPTHVDDNFDIKNLIPGNYYIIARDEIGCARVDFVLKNDISDLKLSLSSVKDENSTGVCLGITFGTVTLKGSGGTKPYRFMRTIEQSNCPLGSGSASCLPFEPVGYNGTLDSAFLVPAGHYTFRFIDQNQCYSEPIAVDVKKVNDLQINIVSITQDDQCPGANGTVTLSATGGVPPYTFVMIDDCTPLQMFTCSSKIISNQNATFEQLSSGSHSFKVLFGNCISETTLIATVPRVTSSVSFLADVKPIFDLSCSSTGCHDGTLGATMDYRSQLIIKSVADKVKTRIENETMPPPSYPFSIPLTQTEKNKILCWIKDGAVNN